MRLVRLTAVIAAAAFACAPLAARADGIAVTGALTLNALDGEHAINGGDVARINFVPLPLAELDARHRTDELHVEGLPPVAFSYSGGAQVGVQTTRLSIGNLAYRRTFGDGYFAGVGQTLYNQHTTYGIVPGAYYTRYNVLPSPFFVGGPSGPPLPGGVDEVFPLTGAEEQYSRVTGMRLEAGRRWSVGRTKIEAIVAGNPHMHGVQYTYVPSRQDSPTFADPEHASQVDVELRAYHPFGRGQGLIYGLRYLHYSSAYDQDPGQLADRNVGLAPVIGYGVKL